MTAETALARTECTPWWWERVPRPALPAATIPSECDVAIVGSGYTGLHAALVTARAGRHTVVFDAEDAGFGCSTRNGGQISTSVKPSFAALARRHGKERAFELLKEGQRSLAFVGDFVRSERIECDFARGGTLAFARSGVQLTRARAEVEHGRSWGDTEADLRLLAPAEVAEISGVSGALGATFTPHCAALDPGRLVRALAEVVASLGVRLFEGTPATRIGTDRRVHTPHGAVSAEFVVRATEAYTPSLRGAKRDLAPVYSLIIGTDPLPAGTLAEIGDRPRAARSDRCPGRG